MYESEAMSQLINYAILASPHAKFYFSGRSSNTSPAG